MLLVEQLDLTVVVTIHAVMGIEEVVVEVVELGHIQQNTSAKLSSIGDQLLEVQVPTTVVVQVLYKKPTVTLVVVMECGILFPRLVSVTNLTLVQIVNFTVMMI
jgi:hypothetical protein